jgi:hypothetical protein
MARTLQIDILGTEYHGGREKNVLYRVKRKPQAVTDYPYIVVSDKFEFLSSSSSTIDLFQVKDYRMIKANLKKSKVREQIGLEVTIAELRRQDSLQVGRWISHIKDLYKFCKCTNCQFILSSGANSAVEMVSGRSFESILRTCEIEPEHYWQELEKWIENKCKKRVFADT